MTGMSDEKLRVKAGKTVLDGAVARALVILPEAVARATTGGKRTGPLVLPDLQGKGPVRREAYRLT